ncbi:30S ribosomal protein S17 [Vermiphilus pyriformis]|uniref:Small ribosomal subunit protein uS17 n=1 Tax=candidate division TM6 bacterium JCVI TM6SC1 TaxID=1306947 RepID=A0A0D2GPL3_9BACT|nr:30S ribosomal protein S17 [candidate division TM6 bacterium JCVI TM6SC1]UNE35372.1 MAG: 30S ribosomal protein S17 [Vermiphilus pyriformis]
MDTNRSKVQRTLMGLVVSDKMDKTVVVKMERVYRHPKFDKTIRSFKKYKVHDENEQAREGDTVEFYEGRPMSKTKYMYLARVIKTHSV